MYLNNFCFVKIHKHFQATKKSGKTIQKTGKDDRQRFRTCSGTPQKGCGKIWTLGPILTGITSMPPTFYLCLHHVKGKMKHERRTPFCPIYR